MNDRALNSEKSNRQKREVEKTDALNLSKDSKQILTALARKMKASRPYVQTDNVRPSRKIMGQWSYDREEHRYDSIHIFVDGMLIHDPKTQAALKILLDHIQSFQLQYADTVYKLAFYSLDFEKGLLCGLPQLFTKRSLFFSKQMVDKFVRLVDGDKFSDKPRTSRMITRYSLLLFTLKSQTSIDNLKDLISFMKRTRHRYAVIVSEPLEWRKI